MPAMRRATRVRGAAAAASRRKECMTTSDALDRARESYGRLAWSDAYAQFAAADQESSLEPADLELLATAAYLLGRDDDSAEIWARAYHELLRRGDPARAAWCAGWLAAGLLVRESRHAPAPGSPGRAGCWTTASGTASSRGICCCWLPSST